MCSWNNQSDDSSKMSYGVLFTGQSISTHEEHRKPSFMLHAFRIVKFEFPLQKMVSCVCCVCKTVHFIIIKKFHEKSVNILD